MDIDVIVKDVAKLRTFVPMLEELFELWTEHKDAGAIPTGDPTPAFPPELQDLVTEAKDLFDRVEGAITDLTAAKADFEKMTADMQTAIAAVSAPKVPEQPSTDPAAAPPA